jgi:hypothetical protein
LGKLRGKFVENGTHPHRDVETVARSFMQLESLDELTQHAGQLRSSILGLRQLFPPLAIDESGQDIVCAGDHL